MANKTVYPFGPGGRLPSGIGLVDDLVTGGRDVALTAEQGKVIGERLDAVEQGGAGTYEMNSRKIVLNAYPVNTYSGWFIGSNGTWNYGGGNHNACVLIPITPGKQYKVYGGTTGTTIALLKSDSMTSGSSADFCTNYGSRISVAANGVYEVTAPEDAAYLYLLTKASDTNKTGYVRTIDIDTNGVIPKLLDDVMRINSQPIDTSSLTATNGKFINSSNKWEANNVSPDNYEIIFIPITAGNKYNLFGNTTGGVFAILKNKTITIGSTPGFCTSYPERIHLRAGMSLSFTAPEDAVYLYVCTRSGGVNFDGYAAVPKHITEQVMETGDSETVEKDPFENAPEYYAWLKSQQMTNIKWTPLKAVPKPSSTAKFTANEEQTGLPYSSAAEYDKRIGHDVSIHTFMTALHNPYSLLYTENIRYDYSQSAYGRRYYGSQNSGAYYGIVCSWFTGYALDMIPYTSADMDRLAEEGIMEVVYDQSANGLKRGDVVGMDGHVMLVRDVWRKNGLVTKVVVSEGWEPLARNRSAMSASTFNTFLATNSAKIYRYKELYKNINYTPSPYVAVGEETPQVVTYNDDICTFAGDKASFIEGDLIYIHCLNLNYPQMEIYKDDVLVETITLASDARAALTSDELAYAVNLTNDNLAYGKYKCRLKNGDSYSDYTYFEVINATVSVDGDIATYSSANAKAVLWYWQRYHSAAGAKIFNMTPLDGKKSGTIDVSNRYELDPLLKVLFQGDYGRVAAQFLEDRS